MSDDVPVSLIIEATAQAFGVDAHEIISERRIKSVMPARKAAICLAFELSLLSSTALGRRFGNRDHSTMVTARKSAELLKVSDADFAAKLEAARLAATALANTSVASCFGEPDAAAVARRVLADPAIHALGVSKNEICAMAARLLDLEEIAGGSFQLLLKIDQLIDAPRPATEADIFYRADLVACARAIIATLSSALAALGYTKEPENEQGKEQGRDAAFARAAE